MARAKVEEPATVQVALSEEERMSRAVELARVGQRVLDLREERTKANREYNSEIKELERRQRDLIVAVNTGTEAQPAQLEMVEGGDDIFAA